MRLAPNPKKRSWPASPPAPWLIAAAITLALFIFVIDALTTLDIAIAVLYVIVILLIALTGYRRLTWWAGNTCIVLTVIGYILPHSAFYDPEATARSIVGLLAIVTTLFLSMRSLAHTAMVVEKVQLLELSHDAIIVHDLDGKIFSWNLGAQRLYGLAEADTVGKSVHTLLNTAFPTPLDTIHWQLSRDSYWEGQLVQCRPDGRTVTVESRWSLWRDASGKPIGILATSNDISERVHAKAALARSEAFLAEAQYLSHTGSLAISFPLQSAWCSTEARRILGFPGEGPVSIRALSSLIERHDLHRMIAVYAAMRGGTERVDAECRIRIASGDEKHVRFVAHRVDGAHTGSSARRRFTLPPSQDRAAVGPNRSFEYVAALMDVTDARRTQEALSQSMQDLAHAARLSTLGELAASIAHEVSQPIAAVATNGQAALRWLDRPQPVYMEAQQAIANMIRDAQRAGDVVRRVRALAQKRAGQRQLIDVNDIVIESLELVERDLQRHQIRLTRDLARELPRVFVDRVQIQQVVMNLLMNALQALANVAAAARRLHVSSRVDDAGHVGIWVEDHGSGLSADSAKRIFSPFFSTKSDGMGMGLVISRSIIDAHGGAIQLRTGNASGEVATTGTTGTTASFWLPSATAEDDRPH